MSRSVEDALSDLRRLADNAESFDFDMPVDGGGLAVRKSAVLLLFGSLDAVPAATPLGAVPPELDVLLLRRSTTLSHHPGQIAFPGGGVEPGDCSPFATAVREAAEETGLEPEGVTDLGPLTTALIPNSGNLVTPVLAWWHKASPLVPDGTETADVFRVPVGELLDPARRGVSILNHSGTRFTGPMFVLGPQFGGHIVWGFTAMILSRVFDELGWTIPWDRSRVKSVTSSI
jgi:8-oxo-dGTP pyrophosphatase MutT (NUDIX family)